MNNVWFWALVFVVGLIASYRLYSLFVLEVDLMIICYYQIFGMKTFRFSKEKIKYSLFWRYRVHVTYRFSSYEECALSRKFYSFESVVSKMMKDHWLSLYHTADDLAHCMVVITARGSIMLIESSELLGVKIAIGDVPEGTEICIRAQTPFKRLYGPNCIDEERKLVFP